MGPSMECPGGRRELVPAFDFAPLTHAVELMRDFTFGTATLTTSALHFAYLLVWIVAGWFLANLTYRRRLTD